MAPSLPSLPLMCELTRVPACALQEVYSSYVPAQRPSARAQELDSHDPHEPLSDAERARASSPSTASVSNASVGSASPQSEASDAEIAIRALPPLSPALSDAFPDIISVTTPAPLTAAASQPLFGLTPRTVRLILYIILQRLLSPTFDADACVLAFAQMKPGAASAKPDVFDGLLPSPAAASLTLGTPLPLPPLPTPKDGAGQSLADATFGLGLGLGLGLEPAAAPAPAFPLLTDEFPIDSV
jgi:hypothetical protein